MKADEMTDILYPRLQIEWNKELKAAELKNREPNARHALLNTFKIELAIQIILGV